MSSARELLEIAADYVEARAANETARNHLGHDPAPADLAEIAERWDAALSSYIAGKR